MDVRLPDGTVVTNVPDNITQEDLMSRLGMSTPAPRSSGLASLGHHALGAVAPTAGGLLAGAGAGAALGGAAGSVFPGVGNFVGGLAGMIGGGLVGGAAVGKAQDYLLSKAPALQKYLGQDDQTRQAEETEHPYMSLTGSFLPQAAAFKVGGLGALGRAANSAITGATEAGVQYGQEGKVDPKKVAIAAGMGALQGQARGPVGKILNPLHQTFNGVEMPVGVRGDDHELMGALQEHAAQGEAPVVAPQLTPGEPPQVPLSGEGASENHQTAISRVIGGEPMPAAKPTTETSDTGGFISVMQDRLGKIAASSPAGKSLAQEVEAGLADKSLDPTQAYFAIHHFGGAIMDVLGGTNAKVGVKLTQQLLKDGKPAQGTFNIGQSLITLSMDPAQLMAYGPETAAHEGFHFLQQTFKEIDPKGYKALGQVYNEKTSPASLAPGTKAFFKSTAYPTPGRDGQPRTFWDVMVEGNGGEDKPWGSRVEAEAHVEGAFQAARANGIQTPTRPGAQQRFSNFLTETSTRLKNGFNQAGFQTADDVLKAYAGGKAGGAKPVAPVAATQQEHEPTDGLYSARGAEAEQLNPANTNERGTDELHLPGSPEREANFKKWFEGAHPAMNASNGEPRRFLHNTTRNFDQFDTNRKEIGTHFGTPSQANGRNEMSVNELANYSYIDPKFEGPRNIPVHLNLKNPVRVRDYGYFDPRKIAKDLWADHGILTSDEVAEIQGLGLRDPTKGDHLELHEPGRSPANERRATARLKEILKAKGYDSMVYLNRAEGIPRDHIGNYEMTDRAFKHVVPEAHNSFIAFDPGQVKSVHNRGTFDANDPRYMYSERKTISEHGEGDFYSPTLKAVQSIGEDTALTGEKWKARLGSVLGRLGNTVDWKGEQEHLGLNDFLKSDREITGKELVDYIRQKSPKITRGVKEEAAADEDPFSEIIDGPQYNDLVLHQGEGYRERTTELAGANGLTKHFDSDTLMHGRTEDVGKDRIALEWQSDPHQAAAKARFAAINEEWEQLMSEEGVERGTARAKELHSDAARKFPEDYGYSKDGKPEKDKVPNIPFKKGYDILNMKQDLMDAARDGREHLLIPATPEQVAAVEGWGDKLYEQDGGYFVGSKNNPEVSKNVTSVVKRAIAGNPRRINEWLKANGYKEAEKVEVELPGKKNIGIFDPDGNPVKEGRKHVTFPKTSNGYRQADDWINGQEDWDQYQVLDAGRAKKGEKQTFWRIPVDPKMKEPMSLWSSRATDFDGDTLLPPEIAYSRRKAAEQISGIQGLEKRMNEVYGPIPTRKSMLERTKDIGVPMTKASFWDKLYAKTVDEAMAFAKLDRATMAKHKAKLRPGVDIIERSTGQDLSFQLSSYKMRSMVNRSAAHAGTDMFTAPFAITEKGDFTTSNLDQKGNLIKPKVADGKYKGREIGGLMEIWAPAYKDGVGDAFHFYMDVKRGMRLLGEGREKVFKAGDQAYANQLEQKFPYFKEMADLTHEFNRMKMDGMVKAGILTRAGADHYLKTGDYTPFYREFEKEGVAGPVYVEGVNTGEGVLFRKLQGSEAELADPLQRWYRHLQAMNHAMLSNESAARAMDQALDLGMARKAVVGDEDTITVRRNGEKIKYVVDDPLLHEALASTDGKPMSAMMQIFRIPTNILRQFTTHVPTFVAMHAMRESMTGFVTGDGKMLIPIVDAVRGIKNSLMNSASAQAIQNHGITGNFDYRPAGGQGVGDKLRDRAAEQLGLKVTHTSGAGELFHKFWNKYEKLLKAADAGVRTRVYEIEMAKHGNPAEAAFQSGAKAVNFQRRGSSPFMSYAFAAIPFLNARIQGTDVILRTMVNQGKAKGLAGVLFSRGMAMAAMTAAYYLAVKDNETYKKAAEIYKDGYWIVPMNMMIPGSDDAFIMPIPFEAGVLYKNIPEHIMRSFFGDDTPEDLKRSMETALLHTLEINPIPQLIRPAVETAANHSFYTGRAIVPSGMEMPGAHQYEVEPSTSYAAKLLGGATGQSPIKIDYLIRGYLGTVGEWAMEASDVAGRSIGDVPPLPNQFLDNPTLANTPLMKRFIRDSRQLGDEEVSRLYDLHGETQGLVRTINRMQGAGDAQGLQDLVKENKGTMAVKDVVNAVFSQISQLNKMEMNIQAMPANIMDAPHKEVILKQIEARKYAIAQSVEKLRAVKKEVDSRD